MKKLYSDNIILIKYYNTNKVFLAKYIIKLLKYININNYIIESKKDKQLFFK